MQQPATQQPEPAAAGTTTATPAGQFKIYFCGSIRGEAVDKPFLRALIQHLQTYGKVLTEQFSTSIPCASDDVESERREEKKKRSVFC